MERDVKGDFRSFLGAFTVVSGGRKGRKSVVKQISPPNPDHRCHKSTSIGSNVQKRKEAKDFIAELGLFIPFLYNG